MDALPVEIFYVMVGFLPRSSLFACRLVSRQWKSMIPMTMDQLSRARRRMDAETTKRHADNIQETCMFSHPEVSPWETPLNFHRLGIWLKYHQSTGVRWMLDREKPGAVHVRGGLLMDEAGLGKTIEMLTLIKASMLLPLTEGENRRRPTLIVCPASLIKVWEDEIDSKFPADTFRVFMYYGSQRLNRDLDALMRDNDIILTSYRTIVSEWITDANNAAASDFDAQSIFRKKFGRIVLDEAHNIKNPACQTSLRVQQLLSERFWCITATSVLNQLNDLFALFSFMSIKPFANDMGEWNARIVNPITLNNKRGLSILYNYMIPITLRRTKAVLGLPRIFHHKQPIKPTTTEREFYLSLFYYSRERVKKILSFMEHLKEQRRTGDAGGNNRLYSTANSSLLTLILRLRQSCVSPALAINGVKRLREFIPEDDEEDEDYAREQLRRMPTEDQVNRAIRALRTLTAGKGPSDECNLCMDRKATSAAKPCNHMACESCWKRILSSKTREARCPWCLSAIEDVAPIDARIAQLERERETIASLSIKAITVDQTEVDVKKSVPSKMRWILNHIRYEHDEKCLIVSQWTSALDIMEEHLRTEIPGTQTCRLDGKINPQKRHDVIREFQNNPDIRICFVSLNSSSEGVTMTAATRVYRLDLWWNEPREYQMDNRVHRIGQNKVVHVYNLYIPGTIEDNMMEMRKTKRKIADASIGNLNTDIHNLPFVNDVKLYFDLQEEDENIKSKRSKLADDEPHLPSFNFPE